MGHSIKKLYFYRVWVDGIGCSVLMMGLLFNQFLEGLLILVLFIPFRIYAGGYHAKTPIQCAIKTWTLFTGAFVYLKFVVPVMWLKFASALGVWGMLFLMAPVQHKNKPLEEYEITKYRRKAFAMWAVETLLMLITQFWVTKTKVSTCVMLAMWMVALLMMLGWYENRKETTGKR